MTKRDNDRRAYFQGYDAARPNITLRVGSVETKDRLREVAAAAGQPLTEFAVDSLVAALVGETLERNDANVD